MSIGANGDINILFYENDQWKPLEMAVKKYKETKTTKATKKR